MSLSWAYDVEQASGAPAQAHWLGGYRTGPGEGWWMEAPHSSGSFSFRCVAPSPLYFSVWSFLWGRLWHVLR